MRALPLLGLVVVAAAACQTQVGEQRGVEVVVRDGRGAVQLGLRRTQHGCIADEALSIFAHSDGITGGAWALARGPSGRELRGPAGLIARIVDEPGPPRRLSIIDPVGVPMARMHFDDAGVLITDGGRSPIGKVERAGGGFRLVDVDPQAPAVRGTVTGTEDLELAARLLVPADISDEGRALFACGRLAVTTPSVK